MSKTPNKADWLVTGVVVASVVLLPLGLYVLGYFALTELVHDNSPGLRLRWYDARWKSQMFYPASKIESWFTGQHVLAIDESDGFIKPIPDLIFPDAGPLSNRAL